MIAVTTASTTSFTIWSKNFALQAYHDIEVVISLNNGPGDTFSYFFKQLIRECPFTTSAATPTSAEAMHTFIIDPNNPDVNA